MNENFHLNFLGSCDLEVGVRGVKPNLV